jgi:hypothetical protein
MLSKLSLKKTLLLAEILSGLQVAPSKLTRPGYVTLAHAGHGEGHRTHGTCAPDQSRQKVRETGATHMAVMLREVRCAQ